MNRLAIMGGTFDPIHYGHLVAAEAVRVGFDLDKVLFIPTGNPPHKKFKKITDAKHRYEMTVLATKNNPYFEVSRIEIDRVGTTYTVDTILQLKKIYGEDTQLFFITGADALLEIHTWYNFEQLLNMCELVAASRPGFDQSELEQKRQEIQSKYHKNIHVIEIPSLAISSTDIRERVRSNRPIRYLLPEEVQQYITEHSIYRE